MFQGRYEHTIDKKGRVSIPVKWREILREKFDERLMITNYQNSLYAYPDKSWQELALKVQSRPQFSDENVTSFMRAFIAPVQECGIDRLGRILIPADLREYAALKSSVVFVGMTTRIEIWDKGRWDEEFRRSMQKIQTPGSLNSLAL